MTVNYNDGKWHGWNGGGCPVHPLSEVEAVWHDENLRTSGIRCGAAHGGAWFNQILKFRVIKEHREPRETWLYRNPMGVVMECDEGTPGSWLSREVIE